MDYDHHACALYTGDEMGFMNKWDLSELVRKVKMMKPQENHDPEKTKEMKNSVSFITDINDASIKKIKLNP